MVKVAINGFGRIGRLLYRAALETKTDIDFAVVNDLTDAKTLAHLLKHDTAHGPTAFDVKVKDNTIIAGGQKLTVLAQPDPAKLPWKDMGVYLAVESTGRFRKKEDAAKHLQAGAKKVLVSAPMSPATSADLTVVYGVNDDKYDPKKHHILSLASCTTNCVSPVAKVLNDKFGVKAGLMTTVHAVTNDQRLLDMQHSDLRRARSAAFNMIPTTTGAAVAATLTLPELEGRMNGLALRVPIPTVSIVDFVATLMKEATVLQGSSQRKTEGNIRLQRRATGLVGPNTQSLLSHHRRPVNNGHRKPRQGAGVVRQRMGLLRQNGANDRKNLQIRLTA